MAPLTGPGATGAARLWLESVEKSVLVRVLKFCPETGTGVVEPPVLAVWSAALTAEKATVSLKFASTGRSC